MNHLKAILFTLISSLLVAGMSTLIRYAGEAIPVGQIVFFRSAFGVVPVLVVYAWRRELRSAVRTKRPLGHVARSMFGASGMFLNFASLARLPVVDAIAFSFSAPLITVAMSAVFLKERVRLYRWSAVLVGFVGVIVMLWPHLDLSKYSGAVLGASAVGALLALAAAFFNSGAVIQTRRLTDTETTSSIVFYFSTLCALAGLATWPLGWVIPDGKELAALIGTGLLGGVAHLFLTESYRYASASLVAPFGYTTMLWALIFGYLMFGEIPVLLVFVGAGIVAAAGIFVIFRERQLGLRRREAETPPGTG